MAITFKRYSPLLNNQTRLLNFDESYFSKEKISSLVMFVYKYTETKDWEVTTHKYTHSSIHEMPNMSHFGFAPLRSIRFSNRENPLISKNTTPLTSKSRNHLK